MVDEKVYTEMKAPEVAPEALALLEGDKSPDEVIIELQKKLDIVTKEGKDIDEIERISFLVTELVKLLDVEPPYVDGINVDGMKGIEVEEEFKKYLEQYTQKLHKQMPDEKDLWEKKITSYAWKQYMKDVIEPQQNYANSLLENEPKVESTEEISLEKVEEPKENSSEKVEEVHNFALKRRGGFSYTPLPEDPETKSNWEKVQDMMKD